MICSSCPYENAEATHPSLEDYIFIVLQMRQRLSVEKTLEKKGDKEMSRMLWYEWKRIWQSRLTQLTVIGCGAFLVFCVWSSIVQMTAVDKSGNQVSGMQAAEALQDTQERITLDQETDNRLLEEYISYTEDPQTGSDDPDLHYLSEETYRTWYLPREELFRIIGGIYIQPENRQDSNGDT